MSDTGLRGHKLKIYKPQVYLNIRKCISVFVCHNASSFSAIIRKLVYSLLCSLRDSNNLLVCALLHSDICLQSSLFERWHKLLHVF